MHTKPELMRNYTAKGRYSCWKERSDRMFGPIQAVKTYDLLLKNKFIPPLESDFCFASVSSNHPTHEYAMWKKDSEKRLGTSIFLAGDIARVKPRLTQFTSNGSYFSFMYWDADRLPLPGNSLDMLWDRKGWLWYLSEKKGSLQQTQNQLSKYHALLKPGGSIVLDAIEGFASYYTKLPALQKKRNSWIHYLFSVNGGTPPDPLILYPKAQFQFESSTVDNLTRLGVWNSPEIKDLFDIHDLGENELKVRVLTKK